MSEREREGAGSYRNVQGNPPEETRSGISLIELITGKGHEKREAKRAGSVSEELNRLAEERMEHILIGFVRERGLGEGGHARAGVQAPTRRDTANEVIHLG